MRKKSNILTIAILMVALSCAALADGIEDRIRALPDADQSAYWTQIDEIAELGAEAVPDLFRCLGGEDNRLDKISTQILETLVYHASRPGADAERMEVEAALIEEIQTDRSATQKILAIRMLGFAGRDASVPVLRGLFREPELAEIARWALCRIPGDKATQALVAALPEASGKFKAGLIQEIANRGATKARNAIRVALGDSNSDVRVAAIEALGRIGAAEDADRLFEIMKREGIEQSRAARAYVRIADSLADERDVITAYLMYQRLVTRFGLPKEARIAGLIGVGETGGDESVPLLIDSILSDDEAVRSAAQAALGSIPYADPIPAIAEVFPDAPVATQRLLIQTLKERGDGAARPLLVAALSMEDQRVQAEALDALAAFESPDDVEHFLAALDRDEPMALAARRHLARMDGKEVTKRIGDLYQGQSGKKKSTLLEILGERRDIETLPVLLEAVTDTHSEIREVAAQGLVMLPEEEVIPSVLDLLDPSVEEDRKVKQRLAAGSWSTRPRPPVASDLENGREGALVVLLRRLGPEDADLLEAYAREESPAVQSVALAGLADASRESSLPLFREAIESRDDDVRREAVRGLSLLAIRIVDQNQEEALSLLDEAFNHAGSDEEKGILIEAYGKTGSPEAWFRIEPLFEEPSLRESVSAAGLALAQALKESDRDLAIAAFQKVGRYSSSPDLVGKVIEQLKGLNFPVDLSDFGYVDEYWITGSFSNREALRDLDKSPADGRIDLEKPWSALGESHEWRRVTMESPDGLVDLTQYFEKHEDCGAFLYAEIRSLRGGRARLLLGSDDDLTVWLNGKKIHEYVGDRGYWLGQDTVDTTLKEGSNTLVMKVLQGRGDWGCGARVVETD